jgi:lipocalin
MSNSLYQLKVIYKDGLQDEDLKQFCSNWLEVKRKDTQFAQKIVSSLKASQKRLNN